MPNDERTPSVNEEVFEERGELLAVWLRRLGPERCSTYPIFVEDDGDRVVMSDDGSHYLFLAGPNGWQRATGQPLHNEGRTWSPKQLRQLGHAEDFAHVVHGGTTYELAERDGARVLLWPGTDLLCYVEVDGEWTEVSA